MQTVISTGTQKLHRFKLDNGLSVIAAENPTADLVACRIFLKNAGSSRETAALSGLSHLLSTVMTKGTKNLTSLEIAEKVESIGASLGAETANDYFLVSLKTVAADFAQMLSLAGEILRNPTFPESEVELEKHLTIQNIRSQQEVPFNVAFKQLREAMYGEHPYGFSVLGTQESVSSLTRASLEEYHQTYFRPDNLIISLSGRIAPEEALNLIIKVFGDWTVSNTPVIPLKLPALTANASRNITVQDTQQAILMLGYLCPGIKNSEYSVLKLINTYLGNGLSSRLFVELREKRGLAYDVSAFYPTRLAESQFVVYMGTAPENTTSALEGLRREVERLCDQILSQEELQAAKNKLLGQYALGKQTNGEIAQIFGWYETLEVGIEFDSQFQEEINLCTAGAVQDVARRYLTSPFVSLVGPEEFIKVEA